MLFAIEKVVEDTALTGQHFPWFSVILWATTIILVVLGGIKMRKRVVKVVVKVLRKAPKKSTGWTALSNQALSEFYNFAGKFNGLYSRLFQAVEGHQIYEVRKSLLAWGERLQTIRAAYYREWYLRNMDDIGLLTNDEVYSRAVLFCKEMQKNRAGFRRWTICKQG